MPLVLECVDDDLTESQKKHYDELKKNRQEAVKKFEETIASRNGQIIAKGDYVTVYQMNSLVSYSTMTTTVPQPIVSTSLNPELIRSVPQPVVTTSSSNTGLIRPAPLSTLLSPTKVSIQNNISAAATNVLIPSGLKNSTVTPGTYQLLLVQQVPKNQSGVLNESLPPSTYMINPSSAILIANSALKSSVQAVPLAPGSILPTTRSVVTREIDVLNTSSEHIQMNESHADRRLANISLIGESSSSSNNNDNNNPSSAFFERIFQKKINNHFNAIADNNSRVHSSTPSSPLIPSSVVDLTDPFMPSTALPSSSSQPEGLLNRCRSKIRTCIQRKAGTERSRKWREKKRLEKVRQNFSDLKKASSEKFTISSVLYTFYLRSSYLNTLYSTATIESEPITEEPDTFEILQLNFPGKIYPSLLVVTKPYLNPKIASGVVIARDRSALDSKLKEILSMTPEAFTEWLIENGLISTEAACNSHVNQDRTPIKMKIGMDSYLSKFPYSGGYVRISKCCDEEFVSIFQSSIFENSQHSPLIILTLIYHWCCNTPANDIKTWMKVVDYKYMKDLFTNLRAVCTAAVHEHIGLLGGPQKTVEVGIIRVGSASSNGRLKQIKADVLAVLDCETRRIRFKALEPQPADADDGLLNIAKHLVSLIHKESVISLDIVIDKSIFVQLGYTNILQRTPKPNKCGMDSIFIMAYLRKILTAMFQSTLSILNARLVQQFLDELSWRECYGLTSMKGFRNITAHIAEQTKIVSGLGLSLYNVLAEISKDPYKNWSYSMVKINCSFEDELQKRTVRDITGNNNKPPVTSSSLSKINNEIIPKYSGDKINGIINMSVDPSMQVLIPLDTYYYGEMPPDNLVLSKSAKARLNVKCCACEETYNNNLLLMKHLYDHAFNEAEKFSYYRCKYCMASFATNEILEEHVLSNHAASTMHIQCLICERKFAQRVTLIIHMHSVHSKAEFPYRCVICRYQTSEYKKVIDHFYDVHNETDKIQCPFCLKILTLVEDDDRSTTITKFFIDHIQKHQTSDKQWKCDKCVLRFSKKNCFIQHKQRDHSSCSSLPGIVHYPQNLNGILMPMPTIALPHPQQQQQEKTDCTPTITAYTINKISQINRPLKPNTICSECETIINDTIHFGFYILCMRCSYATCCKTSFDIHMDTIHENKIERTSELCEIENDTLYCVCGFSSSNPDDCVHHLINCQYKTLYTSAENALNSLTPIERPSSPSPQDDVESKDDILSTSEHSEPEVIKADTAVACIPDEYSDVNEENNNGRTRSGRSSRPRSRRSRRLKKKATAKNDETDEMQLDEGSIHNLTWLDMPITDILPANVDDIDMEENTPQNNTDDADDEQTHTHDNDDNVMDLDDASGVDIVVDVDPPMYMMSP